MTATGSPDAHAAADRGQASLTRPYVLTGGRTRGSVELPIEARHHQYIGDREVFFDGDRGYNVALYRDQGVGYAIASDLDQGQMLRLVSAAVSH